MGEIVSVGAEVGQVENGKKVLFSDINAYEVDLGMDTKHVFCKESDLLAEVRSLILNSVVILSLSAALIAVNEDSEVRSGVSKVEYLLGFLCNLGASAVYSHLLSLMQLSFQKMLRKETFSVVLEFRNADLYIAHGDLCFDCGYVCEWEVEGIAARNGGLRQFRMFRLWFGRP
ncbi:hypothetical protein V6N13_146417 [Hibiscus sabdariffa]|uniref:Uncharacterized protein n=1 Tax=Hibiscus sabdariffa TaxID=183260 RepID=A0ABR2TT22_9ROSI